MAKRGPPARGIILAYPQARNIKYMSLRAVTRWSTVALVEREVDTGEDR